MRAKVAAIIKAFKRARTVTLVPAVRCRVTRRRNGSYSRKKAEGFTKGLKRIEDAYFAVSPDSGSSKTRHVATTYSSSASCPDACSFKGQGCYAEGGQVGIHWAGVDSGGKVGGHIKGVTWRDMLTALKAIPPTIRYRHPVTGRWVVQPRRLRFNVAGDLPGINNLINKTALLKMVKAAGGKKRQQFTYTHKPVLDPDVWGKGVVGGNLRALRAARKAGLVVNLSADTLADADRKAKLGLPVVITLPSEAATRAGAAKYSRTPEGRKVVICPAVSASRAEGYAGRTTGKKRKKTASSSAYLSCAQCGGAGGVALCARGNRDFVIGFPAHGQDEARAEAVFRGEAPTATEVERGRQLRDLAARAAVEEARLKAGTLKKLPLLRGNPGKKRVWRRFRTTRRRPVLAVVMPNWRRR